MNATETNLTVGQAVKVVIQGEVVANGTVRHVTADGYVAVQEGRTWHEWPASCVSPLLGYWWEKPANG